MATAASDLITTSGGRSAPPASDFVAVFLAGAVVAWAVVGGTTMHVELAVCLLTSIAWVFGRLDATIVALLGASGLAAIALTAGAEGPLTAPLSHLGDDTTVLIIAAFVLAKAIETSGLAAKLTTTLVGHSAGLAAYARLALGVFATTFMMPSTSARAGVLVPLVEHAKSRTETRGAQRAIALMAPLVVVLAAFAFPVAAAANLLAIQILAAQTGVELSFVTWIVLATPPAALMAAAAAVVPWLMFRADRRPAATTAEAASGPPADAPAATGALRAGLVLAVVVALWATTAWHPFEPMLVAVLGAVAVTLPRFGVLGLSQALKGVDWSVILLLAAAAHLSEAAAANDLVAAGTADLGALLRQEHGIADGWLIAAMTAVAMLAHLAISSRSARALLLLPVALTVASAAALDPVVVVLAVTAGTGFCVLTPVGSKALIIFAGGDGRDFDKQALLRAGLVLLPIQLAITLGFAAWVWPAFGTTGG